MKGAIRMFGLGAFTALGAALLIASCAGQPAEAAAASEYDEAHAAWTEVYGKMTEAERLGGVVNE
ncbi:hypothetical protein [Bergeriella denitrificans]|uniref:Lipoprotein n=1 Tax=Bergeriella denitrificans TaxID=494 RepID=A0A378UHZ6_BERDE|nr:hypothetical protein [Bergeriella denitrificans]STZ76309.1 Uncharacterised protein [Bergeriella denitrificans]